MEIRREAIRRRPREEAIRVEGKIRREAIRRHKEGGSHRPEAMVMEAEEDTVDRHLNRRPRP
jgi:hypothetical protein